MSARKSYTCWQSTIISDYECSALTWSSARIPPEQYKLDVSFWTIHDRAILWNSNYFSWGWLRYRVSKLSGHQSKNWIELIKEKDCIGVRITNTKPPHKRLCKFNQQYITSKGKQNIFRNNFQPSRKKKHFSFWNLEISFD